MVSASDWPSVAGPLRDFLDAAEQFVKEPGGEDSLRQVLTSPRPFAALSFLMMKSSTYRAAYLPEILAAVARGPHQSLLLARDVLRSLPRSVLEDDVPVILSEMLETADEDVYSRVAEVVVELRLDRALGVLRLASGGHPDEDISELHDDLDGVENDLSRWGRLVQEWPIRGSL